MLAPCLGLRAWRFPSYGNHAFPTLEHQEIGAIFMTKVQHRNFFPIYSFTLSILETIPISYQA